MPVTSKPLEAVVSVWAQEAPGAEYTLLGSGLCIAAQYVLTARHLIITESSPPRRTVGLGGLKYKQAVVPVTKIHCHPDLDVALLELDAPNDEQPWLRVDVRSQDLKGKQVCLYGVLPDEKESAEKPDCDILSYGNNYPYYLTAYRHVRGFSGGAATLNHVMVGVISARHQTESHGMIVPVSAVQEWLQGFPALQRSLVLPGSLSLPPTPIALSAPNAYVHKVRNTLHALLQDWRGQALRQALEQNGQTAAVEILLPSTPALLITVLDRLHEATQTCLQRQAGPHAEERAQTKNVALKILGSLVVLAVDQAQVQATDLAFDPWQGGIQVGLPLQTEAGIEVFLASLGDRSATFAIKQYPDRWRVFGQGSFGADELETGITHPDQLTEVLKRLWVSVLKTERAPTSFGDAEKKRLQARLVGDERRRACHYYISMSSATASVYSPLTNPVLLTQLLETLPSLRVMYVGGSQDEGLLVLDEYELAEAIEAFLLMLRDTL